MIAGGGASLSVGLIPLHLRPARPSPRDEGSPPPTRGGRRASAWVWAWAALVVWLASGCSAGYQGRTDELRAALDAGRFEDAVEVVDRELGVKGGKNAKQDPDAPLLLLERAALLQAQGRHGEAAEDLAQADRLLEVLSLKEDDAGSLGKYLFSDDATIYKAPPHEKLLVNTLGMVSRMSAGDVEGARVEARRLDVLEQYFEGAAPEELELFGLSSYLAGVVFEASGERDEALRSYVRAYRRSDDPAILGHIARLGEGAGSNDEVVQAALAQGSPSALGSDEGEVVVVVMTGRAPYKVAERLPIGAFLVNGVELDPRLSPAQRQEAEQAMASGLLKWINFPVLKGGRRNWGDISVRASGGAASPEIDLDVSEMVVRAWAQDEGELLLAAFVRMVSRALAGATTEAIGEGANLDKALFPGASWLLGAVVEGSLAAADTPDTRSWTALPGEVAVYRLRLPAGAREVEVEAGRGRVVLPVEVRAGKTAMVSARFTR